MTTQYSAVRRLQFCAGHRVFQHESKCRNMHGHNYVLYIHARPKPTLGLDSVGRVIDFSELKAKVGNWIDLWWDHGFIYFEQDAEMSTFAEKYFNHKTYAMPYNPTAENMAKYLCEDICPELFKGSDIDVYKIVLWETENCFVEYEKC